MLLFAFIINSNVMQPNMKRAIVILAALLLCAFGVQAQQRVQPSFCVGGVAAVSNIGSLMGSGAAFSVQASPRLSVEGGFAAASLDVAMPLNPGRRDFAPRRRAAVAAAMAGASYRAANGLILSGKLYMAQCQPFDGVGFGLRSGRALVVEGQARWQTSRGTELGLMLLYARADGPMARLLPYDIDRYACSRFYHPYTLF
ncbi:MAG: hypothetical protein K5650_04585 [Bacteroidales bacterium]|nr:hypothetical protein [Bacteroidales bacterium]